jgi:hypothetical protein
MRFHRIYLASVLALALTAAITACSSGSSSSSSPASPPASPSSASASSSPTSSSPPASGSGSAASAITANWESFFSSSTPTSKRLALLENGSKFSSAVQTFASSPFASAVSAKVDSVKVTSATQATVTYDLTAVGQTVEKGATGTAIYQDGTWKVGDASFCGLLKEGAPVMGIKVPAVCS